MKSNTANSSLNCPNTQILIGSNIILIRIYITAKIDNNEGKYLHQQLRVGQCHWILELCTARVKSAVLAHFSIRVEVLTFVYTDIISSSLLSLSVSVCRFVEDMDIKSFLDDINQMILIRASFILFFVYSIL